MQKLRIGGEGGRRSGLAEPFAVFLRGDPIIFSEGTCKGAGIGISARVADYLIRQALVQQGDSVLHALLHNILVRRIAGFPPEKADKIVGMIAEQLAKPLDRQVLGNVADDMALHPGEHLRVRNKAIPVLQKGGEGNLVQCKQGI